MTQGESNVVAGVDISRFPTPCFVVNLEALESNLRLLNSVQTRTGAKVLLALKGFAMFPVAKLVAQYLSGTTASGLHELLMGANEFGGESHVFSPSFDERDFPQIVAKANHIVFNTPAQWQRFRRFVREAGRTIDCGIRVNPEYSEIEVPLYNPCYANSRLGTPLASFREADLEGITGLHFHTMCEQGAETLVRTLKHVEERFGGFIRKQCRWVNFGGGHHITRPDYNVDLLCETIIDFRKRYNNIEIYLEPGEAVALNTGVLVAQVLDTLSNGMDLAILDTSASTHMPDVLEMPYRPNIVGAKMPNELPFTYRLGGLTCLAGDVIGDYSFAHPLRPGDRLVFLDMAHYSMVKTTTFNGVKLPSIGTYDPRSGEARVVREFGYEEFRRRLG
jgi:carboxynorspermidine decarboxylase